MNVHLFPRYPCRFRPLWLLAFGWALLWGLFAAAPATAAGVIYVDRDAAGTNDGSSWTNAYTSLQAALAAAAGGDEIWVATGVYTPGLGMDSSFVLTNGVALYGGFAGSENRREQRDWQAYLTVLSGDLDGDDTTDAHGVITDTAGITGTNAFHVVTGSYVDGSAILDGFVITGGNATGSGEPPCIRTCGGGIYNEHASPTLTNLVIRGNQARQGGGLSNRESHPMLSNVRFSGNQARQDEQSVQSLGGGMHNWKSSPTLVDVTFTGNRATAAGGGMANDEGNPVLTRVTFADNHAFNGGGMRNWNSSPTLNHVAFTGNSGSGMINLSGSRPSLTDVVFSSNRAEVGGGMYNDGSSPTLTNVLFVGNRAERLGGGMDNHFDSSPRLSGVTFIGNQAGTFGGGLANVAASSPALVNVLFSGNLAASGGGIHNAIRSDPTLTNVTLSGNEASAEGGGVFNYEAGSPLVQNSILWGNSAPIGPNMYNASGTSTPTIRYSLVAGDLPEGSLDGGHNLFADPRFVRSPDPGDGDWSTLEDNDYGDLRLQADSPAIDAGDTQADLDGGGPGTTTVGALATDLGGNARVVALKGEAPVVDLGVYEAGTRRNLPILFGPDQ